MSEKIDIKTRKYITITDLKLWNLIEEIMGYEQYSKSFNKVISEALVFGLPMLLKKIKGDVVIEEEKKTTPKVDFSNDEYFLTLTALMREIVANVLINKSILCSLFNAKLEEYKKGKVIPSKFSSGSYRDTPDYLLQFEQEMLRSINKV